jgi:hypothetical protein
VRRSETGRRDHRASPEARAATRARLGNRLAARPEIVEIPGSPSVRHAATPLFVRPRLSYPIAAREAGAAADAIPYLAAVSCCRRLTWDGEQDNAVSGQSFVSGRGGQCSCKKDGFKVIQTILEQQKPEAAYFIAEGGRRTGILILNMNDASELPRIAEPWFLALNARIEATPAMIPEDLQRAAPAIEQAVKTFG